MSNTCPTFIIKARKVESLGNMNCTTINESRGVKRTRSHSPSPLQSQRSPCARAGPRTPRSSKLHTEEQQASPTAPGGLAVMADRQEADGASRLDADASKTLTQDASDDNDGYLQDQAFPDHFLALVQRVKEVQASKKDDPGRFQLLFWGIVDSGDSSFQLVPTETIDKFDQLLETTFEKSRVLIRTPTCQLLLDRLSEKANFADLSRIVQSTGVSGLLRHFTHDATDALLPPSSTHPGGDAVMARHLDGLDVYDSDASYICISLVKTWRFLQTFPTGQVPNERTLDMKLLGELADPPNITMLYGEMMSRADQQEKQARHGDIKKKGKSVDYLYCISSREFGVGKNSGPDAEPHHDHPRENLVDLAKTAKAQWLALTARLPNMRDPAVMSFCVPFFHVIGRDVNFYICSRLSARSRTATSS
ncbi:hypothetical protein HDU85_006882 [Gaertneriomyces sp. JEL0708]|nr:hypothetical protein HDU85_006882 [Gaertneriomyces sp. JEL0708]